jgi:hypothetical protein
MKIKDVFNMGKKIAPLVPIFGGWKAATLVFAALQFGAPLALKGLNRLQENLEAKNAAKEAGLS